jgi:hypothetical protein
MKDLQPLRHEPNGQRLLGWVWWSLLSWLLIIASGAWYFNGRSSTHLMMAALPGSLLLLVWAIALKRKK